MQPEPETIHTMTLLEVCMNFTNIIMVGSVPKDAYPKAALKEAATQLVTSVIALGATLKVNPANPMDVSLLARKESDPIPWHEHEGTEYTSIETFMKHIGSVPLGTNTCAFHIGSHPTDADRTMIGMLIVHGLSDGVCVMNVFNRWLSTAARLARGETVHLETRPFVSFTTIYKDPKPDEPVMEKYAVPPPEECWKPHRLRAEPVDYTQPGPCFEHLRAVLALPNTERFVAACRAHGVGVQSALNAAGVVGMRSLYGDEIYAKAWTPAVPVNARGRIPTTPEITEEDVTVCPLHFAPQLHGLADSKKLWEVAAESHAFMQEEFSTLAQARSFLARRGAILEVGSSTQIGSLGRADFPPEVRDTALALVGTPSVHAESFIFSWAMTAPGDGLVLNVTYISPAYAREEIERYARGIVQAIEAMTEGDPAVCDVL